MGQAFASARMMSFPRARRPRGDRGISSRGRGGASSGGASNDIETSEEEFPGKLTRKARRRRPWLRVYFGLFVAIEVLVLVLVNEFSPRFDFVITSVTVAADVDTVGRVVSWLSSPSELCWDWDWD